jgi:uncharacterized protein YndB with AHSA1/START domain
METKTKKTNITIQTTVNASVKKVWNAWTEPEHIIQWNNPSADWHTPRAENDLQKGGRFLCRMESRDGREGFDFTGTYDSVEEFRLIEYTMDDGRKVRVSFEAGENNTIVTESFETEQQSPVEVQRGGWQSILDSFKNYVESLLKMEKVHYEIGINAPVETVYSTMLDKQHYQEWTKVFNATSRYEGSWDQGSKIRFIGTDENGNVGGMVSRIAENVPNKKITIEHMGLLQGDSEITSGPEVEGWAGLKEQYTFTKNGNHTRLLVDMDTNREFMAYFEETWPKALQTLKAICEK